MTGRRSPLITLNNGVQLPALGLGVFQSPPEQTAAAVESAITQGYRLIDTAAAYLNERQVGDGLRRSGVARDDVFLETKVWISDYGFDAALHASTCCSCISRCPRCSSAPSNRTGRSRRCSQTARCARSA